MQAREVVKARRFTPFAHVAQAEMGAVILILGYITHFGAECIAVQYRKMIEFQMRVKGQFPVGALQHCPLPEMPVFKAEAAQHRSEEHTSELQSRPHLVCRL